MKVWDNVKNCGSMRRISKCFHFDRNATKLFSISYVPCNMTNYVMDVNNHSVDSKNCIVYRLITL